MPTVQADVHIRTAVDETRDDECLPRVEEVGALQLVLLGTGDPFRGLVDESVLVRVEVYVYVVMCQSESPAV